MASMRSAATGKRAYPGSRQGVAQGVAGDFDLSAKCWSEWQDLNLRPPRPKRGALRTKRALRRPDAGDI
jgi:hypothetical protein